MTARPAGGGFKAEENGEVVVDEDGVLEGGRGTWWRPTPPTPHQTNPPLVAPKSPRAHFRGRPHWCRGWHKPSKRAAQGINPCSRARRTHI